MARAAIDAWGAGAPSLTRGTAAFAYIKAWYAYSLGDFAEAQEFIDKALGLASQEATQALRARALALRGTIQLLEGDAEAAVMSLRQVSAASTRFRSPTLLRHWADYAEVCVLTGRVQEAAATVTALQRRLSAHRSRWGELALMRCRALVEHGHPSLELFDAAVKEFDRDELPYELGRTLRCLAVRQDELGMSVEARRTSMAAAAAFEASGASAWAKNTETHLEVPAAASTGAEALLAQLSAEEQDVARRVLHGLRNREIAQEMFVSVRTVELRLTNIYRALGVHSRAQLIAALTGAVITGTPSPSNGARPHA
jgi:ATP/maltotriose-dependent transcriptional regulator MalT